MRERNFWLQAYLSRKASAEPTIYGKTVAACLPIARSHIYRQRMVPMVTWRCRYTADEDVTRVSVPGYDDRRTTSGPACGNLEADAPR